MTSPRERTSTSSGVDAPARDEPPPRDGRSLLQVLIGSAFGGIVAGLLAALVGSDAVAAVVFGFLIGVLWLWMDLRARGGRDEEPPGLGGAGT